MTNSLIEKKIKEFEEKYGENKPSSGYYLRRIANVGGHYGQFRVVEEIKSFLRKAISEVAEEAQLTGYKEGQIRTLDIVEEGIKKLEVEKPHSKEQEVPYDIKKMILEEAKTALLTFISNQRIKK